MLMIPLPSLAGAVGRDAPVRRLATGDEECLLDAGPQYESNHTYLPPFHSDSECSQLSTHPMRTSFASTHPNLNYTLLISPMRWPKALPATGCQSCSRKRSASWTTSICRVERRRGGRITTSAGQRASRRLSTTGIRPHKSKVSPTLLQNSSETPRFKASKANTTPFEAPSSKHHPLDNNES